MDSLSQFPMRLHAADTPNVMKWQSSSSSSFGGSNGALEGSTRSRRMSRSPPRQGSSRSPLRRGSSSRGRIRCNSDDDEDEEVAFACQADMFRRRPMLQFSDKSASTSRLISQSEKHFQPSDETVNRVVEKYKKRLGKCEKQVHAMKEDLLVCRNENKRQQGIMESLSQDYRRMEEQLKDSRERESTQGAMVLQLRVLCESYESQINKLQKESARKTERIDKERESVRALREEVEELKRENMRLKVEKMNRSVHLTQKLVRRRSDTTSESCLSPSDSSSASLASEGPTEIKRNIVFRGPRAY